MTRVRLRPAHGEEVLARLYAAPHDHARWPDHVERVQATIELARDLAMDVFGAVPPVIADLSCGDAAIARAVMAMSDADAARRLILGDLAPGYEITGPIERTLHKLTHVNMLICCETIEHLDDPDAVLALARHKATTLVLSTPLGEFNAGNPEHYWGWDAAGVRIMLEGAGWDPVMYRRISCEAGGVTWNYQLWGCRLWISSGTATP